MSERIADELDATRGDESEWKKEPANIEVRTTGSSQVVSFRMPPEEFDAMTEALSLSGQSVSEFVRSAIQLRLMAGKVFHAIQTKLNGAPHKFRD